MECGGWRVAFDDLGYKPLLRWGAMRVDFLWKEGRIGVDGSRVGEVLGEK